MNKLYDIDDRGNILDCYKLIDGEWELIAYLDRESGPPPCDQLEWINESGDKGIEEFLMENKYGDEMKGLL